MILFILPLFSGGGAERVVVNLLTGLHNRGHSVGIVVFDKSGPLSSIVPKGVPIYNLGTLTLKNSVIPLVKKIRKLNPSMVFSTFGYINVALLTVSWFLPKKTEIWIREANLPSISLSNNPRPWLMTTLYRFLYKKSDKLICTSIRMKDEFVSGFLVPEDIIEIIPNPVDIRSIRTFALPIKRFDRGGVCYIAAGRLTFQKGFDRLLYWFSKLEDKRATLTILGDGKLKDGLMKQSKLLNLQGRVKFLGFCNNPWQWYAGADIFLLSSRWEGMPNSVLEALTCGTPVIATADSGGIIELKQQTYPGAIVIVGKDEEFIEAMRKITLQKGILLRDSLLPDFYQLDSVLQKVEKLLK